MTTCSPCPNINIEPQHCPEAVIEWYRLTGLTDRKESLSRKDLALKAKQHLCFLGWKFWYVNKKIKWELRYTSPINGKNYISLRKACESCIEDGGCSTINSSTTVQTLPHAIDSPPLHSEKQSRDFGEIDQSTLNEDSQAFSSISLQKCNVTTISDDGSCSTIHSSTTLQVPSTTISSSPLHSKKRPRDSGETDQSTFNRDCEAFSSFSLQKCNVTTISTSKVNEKHVNQSKSEITNSLRSAKRRKVSKMSIMDNNSETCDKSEKVLNISMLENNSKVRGKRKEALKMNPTEGCTFVSWLVKNRALISGTNVFCRGGNNIVKIGNIVFDGIICYCCDVNFNITEFEVHAGCTRNSPSTSILLEDGKSLLECQREALGFA